MTLSWVNLFEYPRTTKLCPNNGQAFVPTVHFYLCCFMNVKETVCRMTSMLKADWILCVPKNCNHQIDRKQKLSLVSRIQRWHGQKNYMSWNEWCFQFELSSFLLLSINRFNLNLLKYFNSFVKPSFHGIFNLLLVWQIECDKNETFYHIFYIDSKKADHLCRLRWN